LAHQAKAEFFGLVIYKNRTTYRFFILNHSPRSLFDILYFEDAAGAGILADIPNTKKTFIALQATIS